MMILEYLAAPFNSRKSWLYSGLQVVPVSKKKVGSAVSLDSDAGQSERIMVMV